MTTSGTRRVGLALLATAVLAGCGGRVTPSIDAAGPSARTTVERDGHRDGSWMAGGLKQHDLLYVTNSNATVSVYRYWQHTLAGVLTHFSRPLGICADFGGNVYVVDASRSRLDEYAHGGSKPIAVIDDRPFKPWGCSVNPKNGAVAVANNPFNSYYKAGNIAVYPPGQPRKVYQGTSNDHFISCAYDDHGDLLTTSRDGYYDYGVAFYYKPKGTSSALLPMDLPYPYGSSGWPYPQAVAWDGKYWVVEADRTLFRYTINIKATYVGSTQLSNDYPAMGPVWIYRQTSKSEGTQVVAGEGGRNNDSVAYWKYPAGGYPIDVITKDLDTPYGVAVSLKTGT